VSLQLKGAISCVLQDFCEFFHGVVKDADKTSEAKADCPCTFVIVGINDHFNYISHQLERIENDIPAIKSQKSSDINPKRI
jgi:hypothetical protein